MKWLKTQKKAQIFYPQGILEISFPVGGCVRISFGPEGTREVWSPQLIGEPELLELEVEGWWAEGAGEPKLLQGTDKGGLRIKGGAFEAELAGDGSLTVRKDGEKRFSTPPQALFAQGEVNGFWFDVAPEETVYGLGQDPAARLDHNHQERRMWNQWGGHERSGNNGIGLFASTGGYGMLLATPADARFCFNESAPQPLDSLGEAMVPSQWEAAGACPEGRGLLEVRGALEFFLLFGEPGEVVKQYYSLTGLPGLMPKWAYGFHQCKNRYMNREDLLATARKLRQLQIPCDSLIIDWLWFAEFGDLEWREDDWPRPKEMLKELKELGFSVSSAQHPFISEKGKYYSHYVEEGFLNQVPETKRITYDHTNPRARAHWWEKTARLYRQGIRGYWTDMGELEEHFDGTISAAGGRTKTHNAYSLLWAQGLYEGQREEFGTRPFLLSRAACAGIQKYGTAMWSGDINASWQVLKGQVVLAQTMAMSGIPWWGTDIGGFLSGKECTPELYVRWMEWGVFCGLFRTHGTRPGNEADSFGEEAYQQILSLIRLRYRLMPYIYSRAMECALKGELLITPLSCAFPEDGEAAVCQEEYMFGSAILVAPVTAKGQRSLNVYLPKGHWFHWWTGKKYSAGWHRVPAPLGQIPFFVRGGAILPVYAEIGRNAGDCGGLTLLDVPGDPGACEYYDDAGDGFGYEKGEYTHVRFVRENGGIRGEILSGEMPEYQTAEFGCRERWQTEPEKLALSGQIRPGKPELSGQIRPEKPATAGTGLSEAAYPQVLAAVDTGWQGDQAEITLTFLENGDYTVCLRPEDGWCVTGCTQGGCGYDIEEPAYAACWQGEIAGKAGETVRWQLHHIQLLRRVGVQRAEITLKGAQGQEQRLMARWDGPFLSAPAMLGCLPPGASRQGFAPEKNPWASEYVYEGKTWRWIKDSLFGHNCFGYVEFRRLDPVRKGEEMLGEGWSRENLYSKEIQEVEGYLRYDSPIVLWQNGVEIYRGDRKNDCEVPLKLHLKKGENTLVIRQIADIPRPYSGGEFGYCLKLVGTHKIYTVK